LFFFLFSPAVIWCEPVSIWNGLQFNP
jgi:hypothetical protein